MATKETKNPAAEGATGAQGGETATAEAQPKSAEERLAELEQELQEKNTMIGDQAKIIKAHDATKGDDTPLVTRASGTYQVKAGAKTEDGQFTRKQIAENDNVFDKLLKKGFPGIVKVG